MVARLEQEHSPLNEVERPGSVGVALVIVAIGSYGSGDGPLVWTIAEKTTKPETEKYEGQISLPAETKKTGEKLLENLVGALAEFTDSDEAIQDLFILPETFISQQPALVRGMQVDIAFLLYRGPTQVTHIPLDTPEIEAHGWMPAREIAKLNGEVRGLAHDSLTLALSTGVLETLAREQERAIPLRGLLHPDFSIRRFIQERDKRPDISLS